MGKQPLHPAVWKYQITFLTTVDEEVTEEVFGAARRDKSELEYLHLGRDLPRRREESSWIVCITECENYCRLESQDWSSRTEFTASV